MEGSAYLSINLVWALVCLAGLFMAWTLNAAGAPGNWGMVIIALLYSWLMPSDSPYAFGLFIVFFVGILALIGEVLEFFTGAIGTKKAGGSSKGMWCSILGSIVGSIVGIFIGVPIPIIGSLVGALLFSGAGAMVGAYYGELWNGKTKEEAWRVGLASFLARLLGSVAKLACGLVALLIAVAAMLI